MALPTLGNAMIIIGLTLCALALIIDLKRN